MFYRSFTYDNGWKHIPTWKVQNSACTKFDVHRFRLRFCSFVDDATFYRINAVCIPSYSLVFSNLCYWSSCIAWRQNNGYTSVVEMLTISHSTSLCLTFAKLLEMLSTMVFLAEGKHIIKNDHKEKHENACIVWKDHPTKKWNLASVWRFIKDFREMGTADRKKELGQPVTATTGWIKWKSS